MTRVGDMIRYGTVHRGRLIEFDYAVFFVPPQL